MKPIKNHSAPGVIHLTKLKGEVRERMESQARCMNFEARMWKFRRRVFAACERYVRVANSGRLAKELAAIVPDEPAVREAVAEAGRSRGERRFFLWEMSTAVFAVAQAVSSVLESKFVETALQDGDHRVYRGEGMVIGFDLDSMYATVFKSPHVGRFSLCSPCYEGYADLERPNDLGVVGLTLPPGWVA